MTVADRLLIGRVVALDDAGTEAEAIALRGDRVLAVGSVAELSALRSGRTEVHDFAGATIIPGFNDTHAHLDSVGLARLRPSLDAARSIADIVQVVRGLARITPPGQWIVTTPVGRSPFYFDPPSALAERRMPNRHDLDAAAPDHLVCISAPSGYWGQPPCYTALNSRALQLNGIDRNRQPSVAGVEIERDAAGEPTGVIIDRNYPESALLDLLPAVPRFTADERREAVRQAQPIYHAFGTTSIYEGHGCAPVVIAQYRELHELGQLSMRTGLVVNPVIRSIEDARRMFADWLPHARGSGIGDATLRVTGIHVPFGGDPTVAALAARDPTDVSWSGYVKQAFSPPQFEALAMLAAQHGLRLHTVASDRVDEILPILERVDAAYPLAGRRWVLEHLSRTRPESIARIRRLGLLVTVIPAYHVWKVGDRYRSLDEQAQQGVVPVRQLLDAGVPVAAGTDAVPADPLFTVWAMVTRATRGSAAPLGAAARLDVERALRLMTVAGAALTYDEQRKGPLAPGYFADLTVLSEDPRVVEVDRIPQLRRIATMVGGRFVAGEPAD